MDSTPAATRTTTPVLAEVTPAGGHVNAGWGRLSEAIDCLAVLVAAFIADMRRSRALNVSHVVFRCGTVVLVSDVDPEFEGYSGSEYKFPEHRVKNASTIVEILADNAKVWEAQRVLPGAAGKAARQGFAKLVAQGYPYPGGPSADRLPTPAGISSDDADELWFVFWPNFVDDCSTYNMAFTKEGPMYASGLGADLRRYDYMFPEVAAVFTPDMEVWAYGPDGKFSVRTPQADSVPVQQSTLAYHGP